MHAGKSRWFCRRSRWIVYPQQFSTNWVIHWSNGKQQKASEMGKQVCHQWKWISFLGKMWKCTFKKLSDQYSFCTNIVMLAVPPPSPPIPYLYLLSLLVLLIVLHFVLFTFTNIPFMCSIFPPYPQMLFILSHYPFIYFVALPCPQILFTLTHFHSICSVFSPLPTHCHIVPLPILLFLYFIFSFPSKLQYLLTFINHWRSSLLFSTECLFVICLFMAVYCRKAYIWWWMPLWLPCLGQW